MQKTGTLIDSEVGENSAGSDGMVDSYWLTLNYVDENGRHVELTLAMSPEQYQAQFAI